MSRRRPGFSICGVSATAIYEHVIETFKDEKQLYLF